MTTAANTYLSNVVGLLGSLDRTQGAAIDRLATRISESLSTNGVLHVFGSGHSMLSAIDATFRAGGLAPVNLLFDPGLAPWEPTRVSQVERLHGYGPTIGRLADLRTGEVIIVISNSGINPVPVELAGYARDLGLFVGAITSVPHSSGTESREANHQRLLDVCDVVIDTGAPSGDTTMALGEAQTGPVSTILATAAIHAVIVRSIELLTLSGIKPPVLRSQNLHGTDEGNQQLIEQYAERLNRKP